MKYAALFERFLVPYSTRENRGWVNVACPWCGDRTYNGGFNAAKNYYNCWKCGGHGHDETLALVLRVGKDEIRGIIKAYRGGEWEGNDRRVALAEKLVLPSSGLNWAERKYLAGRNFKPSHLVRKYGVCGGGIAGRWRYRVIIPLYMDGVLVSWVARSILPKGIIEANRIPRYKNLSVEESVVNPKETFFNLDHCGRVGVMVEGTFDVMRLGDGFFCSLGTTLTNAQVALAARRFDKVTIVFDDEGEAQRKAVKFAGQLAAVGVETAVCNAYKVYGVNDGAELTGAQAEEISNYFFKNT